jgi:hypothetical protein
MLGAQDKKKTFPGPEKVFRHFYPKIFSSLAATGSAGR